MTDYRSQVLGLLSHLLLFFVHHTQKLLFDFLCSFSYLERDGRFAHIRLLLDAHRAVLMVFELLNNVLFALFFVSSTE